MSPDRFAEVESAFHRMLLLQVDDRTAALDVLRTDEPDLADEVERLLRAGDATWQLGEWGSATEPSSSQPPGRIGGFRVVGELGRGGMGVVYLGERDDDEFRQRVALKVVQRGFDAEMLGRLRRERQILATLDHPNIARLVDGGSTDDGRPFFAMDHIEGRDLLSWCNDKGLDVRQRVELFLDVCAAVQYAHRNLVIHRDLKPSNILVTDDGVPKLLDFGIAKLLATEAGDQTRTGLAPMTPDYASPEQMLGQPLTTATDVYSLGVVLFELLAGRHPYSEKLSGPASLARLLHAANVPRASSLAEGKRAKAVRGDLDNILAMALRREPERRYPSVAELADDLRRYLELRPVRAHPESVAYRLGRFVRRQKLLAAAGLLVITSLSVGIAGTTWQAHKAERARAAAEEQAELASTVSSYLVEIFGEPDPGKHLGNEPKASDLLTRGRERLDDLEGQPAVQAELALVIGQAYQQLGNHAEAADVYRRGLELRRTLVEPPDPDLVEALLHMADAESATGDTKQAEKLLLEALEQQHSLDDDPLMLATLRNHLGVVRYRHQDYDGASADLQAALAMRQEHLGPAHVDTAETLANLGSLKVAMGEVSDAIGPLQQALAVYEETVGTDHPDTLWVRSNLATLLFHLGRKDEAIDVHQGLIDAKRRVYGRPHPEIGLGLLNLGWMLAKTDQSERRLEVFDEAVQMLEETTGAGSDEHISALVGRARTYADAGKPEEAIEDFQTALREAGDHSTDSPNRLNLRVVAGSGLGRLLAAQGDLQAAVRALCDADRVRERLDTEDSKGADLDHRHLQKLLSQPGGTEAAPDDCLRRLRNDR